MVTFQDRIAAAEARIDAVVVAWLATAPVGDRKTLATSAYLTPAIRARLAKDRSSTIRARFSDPPANPFAEPARTRPSNPKLVNYHLAGQPSTSGPELARIAAETAPVHHEAGTWARLVDHANTPASVIDRIVRDELPWFDRALGHPAVCQQAAADCIRRNPRMSVHPAAQNPHLAPDTARAAWAALEADGDPMVRRPWEVQALAENAATPADVLAAVAASSGSDARVFAALAGHEHTPVEVFATLPASTLSFDEVLPHRSKRNLILSTLAAARVAEPDLLATVLSLPTDSADTLGELVEIAARLR